MNSRTLLTLFAAALAGVVLATPAWSDQTAVLKDDIHAAGVALTLGDVFDNAGAAGARAIAPAPKPGETKSISASILSAAAAAAGLDWTPPAGLEQINVSGPSADIRRDYAALTPRAAARASVSANPVIRSGEMVTLSYAAPGLQITVRAKAVSDGAQGQAVRLVNLQSNRVVDATVTGPGAASANMGAL